MHVLMRKNELFPYVALSLYMFLKMAGMTMLLKIIGIAQ